MNLLKRLTGELARIGAAALVLSMLGITAIPNATVWKWSTTAATNATADSTVNWAEGMAPSAVNDSARAMMAALAKYRTDMSAVGTTTGGSSSAYTVTTSQGLTSLAHGFTVGFIANHDNANTPTLNVDGLGAKPLRLTGSVAAPVGTIRAASAYTASYESSGDQWLLVNAPRSVPVGTIVALAGDAAPLDGWLLSYGQAVSRTTYAALFAIIGTTYGVGDGSTTFNLPDVRGRFIAGQDDMGGSSANRITGAYNGDTLGVAGGAEAVTLTSNEIPAHTHSFSGNTGATNETTSHVHTHTTAAGKTGNVTGFTGSGAAIWYGADVSPNTGAASVDHTHAFSGNTGSYGNGQPFSIIPPSIVLNYAIKY